MKFSTPLVQLMANLCVPKVEYANTIEDTNTMSKINNNAILTEDSRHNIQLFIKCTQNINALKQQFETQYSSYNDIDKKTFLGKFNSEVKKFQEAYNNALGSIEKSRKTIIAERSLQYGNKSLDDNQWQNAYQPKTDSQDVDKQGMEAMQKHCDNYLSALHAIGQENKEIISIVETQYKDCNTNIKIIEKQISPVESSWCNFFSCRSGAAINKEKQL